MVTWYGMMAPAKTPREIVTRLHAEIVKALARSDIKDFLDKRGFEAGGITPDEFTQVIKADLARWEKVIKQANIRVQ